jgi:DnaK suppressor protein
MTLIDSQRERMRQHLLYERERITEALRRISRRFRETAQDASGDLSITPFHAADLGSDEFERELDSEEETRMSRELADVNAALDRLYSHPESFGRDERTGEPISLERLEEIPWARTGIEKRPE